MAGQGKGDRGSGWNKHPLGTATEFAGNGDLGARFSLRLPESAHKKLTVIGRAEDRSMNWLINQAISEFLEVRG
jgi:hypothetical protein